MIIGVKVTIHAHAQQQQPMRLDPAKPDHWQPMSDKAPSRDR